MSAMGIKCRCVIVRDDAVIGAGFNLTNELRNVSAALPQMHCDATKAVSCICFAEHLVMCISQRHLPHQYCSDQNYSISAAGP